MKASSHPSLIDGSLTFATTSRIFTSGRERISPIMQSASGSMLPQQHNEALTVLVRNLATYRNRNSRVIGDQFRQFPPKDRIPEYFTKENLQRRTLDMVMEALEARRYTDPTQVYHDIYWSFQGIAETTGKSSLNYRDAIKMEGILDELWQKNKQLPPLSSLDLSFRAPPESTFSAGADDSMSMSQGTSAQPSPAPQLRTDHLHPVSSMSPVAAMSAGPSSSGPNLHRPSPSITTSLAVNSHFGGGNASGSKASSTLLPSGSTAAVHASHPHTQPLHSAQPQGPAQAHVAFSLYMQQMHQLQPMSIFYPLPSGDQGIEVPIQMPPTVYSSEARKRVQEQQDAILAARSKVVKGKKRKRETDEIPDESSGWLESRGTGGDQRKFYLEIIARLKAEKDPATGRSLSAPIINLPSQEKFPQFYQYIKDPHPPTLSSVEKHIRTNIVHPSDFDAELCTIFANGRIWPAAGMNSSDGEALPPFYGDTLCLQRLYQEMTKGTGQALAAGVQATELASVPFGPGSLPVESEEIAEGQTRLRVTMSSNRLPSSQKTFLSSVNYKGDEFTAGDFIHLFNPSNARLPIVAQIFKCYKKNGSDDRYVTVNWYYRPSQTIHAEDRTFYEQEVFKSSLFIDHRLEDLIERVSVMHISDYTKGRYEYWEEDMPLYVVEHRWNVDTNSFTKIKNWQLCIPEGSAPDPLTFRPFVDSVPAPPRIKSPFFRDAGITGPGQTGDSLVYEADEQVAYYTPLKTYPEGTGGLTGYARTILGKALAPPIVSREHTDRAEREAKSAAATAAAQKKAKASRNRTDSPAIEEGARPNREDFEASTPAEHAALQERFGPLPEEIKNHFRIDPQTKEMLWFTAPPLEIVDGAQKKVSHTLDYLAHMAKKMGY